MALLKRFVIISMLFAFLVLAGTGIVKFPETQRYFIFIYGYLSASTLAMIHDWSGIVLAVLIVIHLILKRQGLKMAFIGDRQISKKFLNVIYVLVGVIVAVGLIKYAGNNRSEREKVIKLSDVEVKEYQGEKLGSIHDFRENSIKGPQYVDRESYKLEITGLVSGSKIYSYDEILKLTMYKKVVTLNCVEGWSVKGLWEGVLVRDLLKDLEIKPEAKTIIFYAADGYSTSFPLDYILQNDIIMADKLNGLELPPERGFPFQLVAEQKWGYKWIKWITKIELSEDVNYKGFWESRGYNNNGDLSGSKFAQ